MLRRRSPDTNDIKGQYAEIILSLMMIRFVILALVLVFLAPKQDPKTEENRDRGNLRIEVIWESDRNVDVDTWVMGPDSKPIGWSNKNGRIFDLVRDDLGNLPGPRYEIVYARGLPAGDYVVNVHLYANRESEYPRVPVQVLITQTKEDTGKGSQQKVFERRIHFDKTGQEITVARFTVDNNQTIIPSSVNTLPKPIYTASR